jgi:hypothetical protein
MLPLLLILFSYFFFIKEDFLPSAALLLLVMIALFLGLLVPTLLVLIFLYDELIFPFEFGDLFIIRYDPVIL